MSFPLCGNERLRDTCLNALKTDRMPHALLLEGDAGLGKRTLARRVDKAVLWTGAERPCGECRSCVLFEAGTHPDLISAEPEKGKKSVSVEKIRELRQQAFVKPHISNRRVFLLENCGNMNEQSQNALLKILEEPPRGVTFILTAPSRTALLDTVVSRCVVMTLSPPERRQAIPALQAAAAESGIELSRENADAALDAAAGNIGAALTAVTGKTDETAAAAESFVAQLSSGKRTELLKILQPFSKDRVAADRLLSAIRRETASAVRSAGRDIAKMRILNRFYSQLDEYDGLLKTNINLPLLFTAMVSRIER